MNTSERAGNVNGDNQAALDKPIWGAEGIGEVIDRTPRQVFHLYHSGALKSIRKVGGRLVAPSARALLRELGAS
jgi:hypothetical protein